MLDDNKIIFQEEDSGFRPGSIQSGGKLQEKFINLIMKISGGLIKNRTQALYVMIGLVILFFILSFIFFVKAFKGPGAGTSVPSGSEVPQDVAPSVGAEGL